MVEMLNWKEALEYLTDNDLYTNDEYLTGNLEVNQEQTQEMYEYPNMQISLDDKPVDPEDYANYHLDIKQVVNKYADYRTFNNFKITFIIPNNYSFFGMKFTNVYLGLGSVTTPSGETKFNLDAKISYSYIKDGAASEFKDVHYYFNIPTNFLGKVNQYVDFNYLNTHVVDSNLDPQRDYIIPEGATIQYCTINSIEFGNNYNINPGYKTGYVDFYSPDTEKIILSTNRLFDSIYNVNDTTRFTEETDELTRRLISKGVLADALFAEEVKCKNRWSQIFNKISETQDEYSKLIRIQQDNIATITDAIKNVTTIKFNDTPQVYGDYSGSEYNSTVTTTESEVQLGSLADKLEIAKKALSDLYDSWIGNFKTFYIY